MLPHDGGDAEEVLGELARAGVDHDRVAADLQRQGAAAFVKSWDGLLACIEHESAMLEKAR
jgi:transaldolase